MQSWSTAKKTIIINFSLPSALIKDLPFGKSFFFLTPQTGLKGWYMGSGWYGVSKYIGVDIFYEFKPLFLQNTS